MIDSTDFNATPSTVWLFNVSNPYSEFHKVLPFSTESYVEAFLRERLFYSAICKIGRKGDPQPTDNHTSEELKEMGIVGIYRRHLRIDKEGLDLGDPLSQ